MKAFIILCGSLLFLVSCNRNSYKAYGYENFAVQHRTLAILPAETIMVGRIPEELTEEDIEAIENAESQAFQAALFHQLAKESGYRPGDIQVNFQHYKETNKRLQDAGIDLRESWNHSPTELAELLEVDAVVITSYRKARYLTELESFGINLATTLTILFTDAWWWWWPNSRMGEVFAACSVIDGNSGTPIWSTRKRKSVYWNNSHRDLIYRVTRVISRRFPYRELY